MDIKKYLARKGDAYPKIKTPEKKPRRVVNTYTGNYYEDTDFMVCSICIKLFKTYDKYEMHMSEHERNISPLNSISIMKVFKEVSGTEANNANPNSVYSRSEDTPMINSESAPTTSSSIGVAEHSNNPYSTAEAIVQLGLPETFGNSIKNLTTTIKTINVQQSLQGNNTLMITVEDFRRSITAISKNIRDQLLRRLLQSSYFTLHLAEFLDIKNFTTLIATVRYKHEGRIENEILFCQQLKGTQADEIYLIATKFMEDYNLNWKNCVGISMDYIRGQCEQLNIFMELIFNSGLTPCLTYTFSRRADFINQQLLGNILQETLRDSVAILNILKRDMSLKFERDMDDGYHHFFHCTDKYWLSYGRLLSRLLEMRDQCKDMPELINFKDKLNDINWLHKLAYLADIFEGFNRFNRDLQFAQFSTFHIYDKITARIDLLKMYKTNVENHDFSQFPLLQQFLASNEPRQNVHRDISSAMAEHLRRLQNNMNRYLPMSSEIENCAWIRNPFDVDPDKMPSNLSTGEKEMLLNLKKDGFIKTKFDEEKLDYFWSCADKNYPDLASKAMKYLLVFTNSHLSELGFASLVDIRANNLTDLEHEERYLLIKLSNIQPDLRH